MVRAGAREAAGVGNGECWLRLTRAVEQRRRKHGRFGIFIVLNNTATKDGSSQCWRRESGL